MLSLASTSLHVCHFDSIGWGGEDPEIFPKDVSPVTNFLLLIPPPYDPTTFKQLDKQATKPLTHVWHKDFIMYMYLWLNIKILTIFLKPIQEYNK